MRYNAKLSQSHPADRHGIRIIGDFCGFLARNTLSALCGIDAPRFRTRTTRRMHPRNAQARTHAPMHTPPRMHANARTREGPQPRSPNRNGTSGRFARAPSALYSRSLHRCSEPCRRGVADKGRITQGTMHTAKRNDKGYYRGTRYCLSRKIFRKFCGRQ